MNNPLTTEFSDRLLTLPDGRPGLRGTLQVEAREPDPSTPDTRRPSPVLDFISSDETLDRYGEIIAASGWRLENYRRNPVFQNAHQYGDVIFTLGRALITEVRVGRLYQQIEFATEVNPMARIAYGLYKGKFLNAVSVGFIPLRWVNGAEEGRSGKSEGRIKRKYVEQELLEVSAVGIPANPNALALGLKSGAVERSDLRELNELIRQTLGQKKPGDWEEVAITVRPQNDFAELVRLAKAIRDLLKA